jgi:oligoribonuclease NrnB/cAMP/cGMP phosphodiesterase (DHH superfamily)
MSRPLCIYHGNCADGFGAAWVVNKYFKGEVDFYAARYQEPPPDVTGRDVIMVDFSYKRDVLIKIYEACKALTIIDHHKTAVPEIEVLRQAAGKEKFLAAYIDMEHSGAILTWQYFYGNKEPPKLLQHIEDRDLWKFELDGTREIQAALFSYPYDFEVWTSLMEHIPVWELWDDGIALERKHFKDINELLAVYTRPMLIGGYHVNVANLPYTMSSDAGHILSKTEAFGACYSDSAKGRYFSLRSTDEGPDVSEIAKQYGGGGHRNAAGFEVPFSVAREMEINE